MKRDRSDSPRFVDAHLHCASSEDLEEVTAAGIVAVRTAGSAPVSGRAVCLHSERPLVVSSCWALYKKGGYGGKFGVPVGSPAEIRAEVLKLKQAGADIIKTMASGMVSLRQPGTITAGGFGREELAVIVREADAAGLGVMCHANGEAAIMAAAEAGVRSIEHGFFMTEAALEALAGNNVAWVPTTGALARAAAGAPSDARQFVDRQIEQHLGMIARAHSLNVLLAVGTDCVLPDPGYREAFEAELGCFRQAGLSAEAVAQIATGNGARLLGLSEQYPDTDLHG